MVKHQIVQIPATKMSLAIASILKEEGFIEDFESYVENQKIPINVIEIYRKKRNPVICKIKRISKTRITSIFKLKKNYREF
jgi:small subunit ribosomal protein S8